MLDEELGDVVKNLRALGADDADVEAKRAEDRLPRSVRDTLSAFANTRGGMLILGLDEMSGFRASGVRNAAKMVADLGAVCAGEMDPPLRPLIRTHRFEGVDVIVAEVPALDRTRRPCFARGADSRQATAELGDLVARGLVVQTGSRRWARYELVSSSALGAAPGARADRRREVLEALGAAELTRAEIAERLGMSGKTVARWLRILRNEGTVDVVGESIRSPKVRYRRTGKAMLGDE
ncbi:RNA-binding domain-containing protein [Amycolatopsis alkalitolerans]|uniref:ArsR family transcriptional regulator n=1 Tax=Amycolatopsis alkalitolerans TaxID=2547244 RepID=A0A5C4LWR4_9PSEU|nr:RNA-binding domain-containing protein [Amycolatopsis alkalitolerans]TNC22872.1 ArsR family transcriptional regulator [Amycolatopsis alkalitolerans]